MAFYVFFFSDSFSLFKIDIIATQKSKIHINSNSKIELTGILDVLKNSSKASKEPNVDA